ncbi:MAG: protein phosphatase 2C domain-containing protein [Candidatus Nomurabacteria bacterium]|jgi:hypothetical protein|nr:protein phosphatase 2C domain-containing protein [Candidatus Nomurabacteria bacterium]
MIVLSKIGNEHLFAGVNRQDMAFATWGDSLISENEAAEKAVKLRLPIGNTKFALDGCGSMKHSEVGAKLFSQLLVSNGHELTPENFERHVDEAFWRLTSFIPNDKFRFQNLSFTILAVIETADEFVVKACGDGYVLGQRQAARNGLSKLIFGPPAPSKSTPIEVVERLDDGDYPSYYVYNFIVDKNLLDEYRDGVAFQTLRYSKSEWANIGVATDGYRFVPDLEPKESETWKDALMNGKRGILSKVINRNQAKFKDDISICL